jgi:hypothetical protein
MSQVLSQSTFPGGFIWDFTDSIATEREKEREEKVGGG